MSSFTDGLMPLKNSELEPQVQKYRGRVVQRKGCVTRRHCERRNWAEKLMDVIARLPDSDGQATQEDMEDAQKILENFR